MCVRLLVCVFACMRACVYVCVHLRVCACACVCVCKGAKECEITVFALIVADQNKEYNNI